MGSELLSSIPRYYAAAEAAEILGISKQTLIRYEKRGLIPPARRNALNGWREYTGPEILNLKKLMGR
ncbi:MAG: MerR family DNA-binding transcriptional regulator [Candidatus Omnitrophica bacterium]|nr:MerR family DNA-binding transcriptional regulator [Candidatus Omnitrophota bacterium]